MNLKRRHIRPIVSVAFAATAASVALALTTGMSEAGRRFAPDTSVAGVSAATLPPLPAGWPNRLEIGMADAPGGDAAIKATANFGFRYQYLAGGVNTGNGWATWNTNGAFATYYQKAAAYYAVGAFPLTGGAATPTPTRTPTATPTRTPTPNIHIPAGETVVPLP